MAKIDVGDLKKFREHVHNLETGFEAFLEKLMLDMALKALSKTKKRQSGHYGETFKAIDTGMMSNSWAITSVTRQGNVLSVWLYNTADYSLYVEEGHMTANRKGWVPGKWMCKVSIEEIERELPARFEGAFRQYIKSLGG